MEASTHGPSFARPRVVGCLCLVGAVLTLQTAWAQRMAIAGPWDAAGTTVGDWLRMRGDRRLADELSRAGGDPAEFFRNVLVRSKSPTARATAAAGLARCGTVESLLLVFEALRDPDETVRRGARDALKLFVPLRADRLRNLPWQAAFTVAVIRSVEDGNRCLTTGLDQVSGGLKFLLPRAVTRALTRSIGSSCPGARLAALDVFGHMGVHALAAEPELLAAFLATPDNHHAASALVRIGWLGRSRVDRYVALCSHKDIRIRALAAAVLTVSAWDSASAWEVLAQAIDSRRPDIQPILDTLWSVLSERRAQHLRQPDWDRVQRAYRVMDEYRRRRALGQLSTFGASYSHQSLTRVYEGEIEHHDIDDTWLREKSLPRVVAKFSAQRPFSVLNPALGEFKPTSAAAYSVLGPSLRTLLTEGTPEAVWAAIVCLARTQEPDAALLDAVRVAWSRNTGRLEGALVAFCAEAGPSAAPFAPDLRQIMTAAGWGETEAAALALANISGVRRREADHSDAPAIEQLAAALRSHCAAERTAVVSALSRPERPITPGVVIELLRPHVESDLGPYSRYEDRYVQRTAAWILGELGAAAHACVPALEQLAARDDSATGLVAAFAAVKIDPTSASRLVPLIVRKDLTLVGVRVRRGRVVRRSATGRVDAPPVRDVPAFLRLPTTTFEHELRSIAPVLVPAAATVLTGTERAARLRVVLYCTRLSSPEAIALLVRTLVDEDDAVAKAARRGLLDIGAAAGPALREAAQSENEFLRFFAADLLRSPQFGGKGAAQ